MKTEQQIRDRLMGVKMAYKNSCNDMTKANANDRARLDSSRLTLEWVLNEEVN